MKKIGCFLVFLFGLHTQAATILKEVEDQTQKQEVVLHFDTEIENSQIRVDYLRDIIQITVQDASIYPAKILNPKNSDTIQKIFAYQYSPKTVRARLTVMGKAEDYKKRFRFIAQNKKIVLAVQPESADQIVSQASSVQVVQKVQKEETKKNERAEGAKKNAPVTVKSVSGKKEEKKFVQYFLKAVSSLAIVLLLFGVIVALVKKVKTGRLDLPKLSFPQFSSIKIFQKTSKQKAIEVISTHHLGPKQSISIVKIKGRELVLGITGDSINLITDLQNQNLNTTDTEVSKKNQEFLSLLQKEEPSPKPQKLKENRIPSQPASAYRSQVLHKLREMRSL